MAKAGDGKARSDKRRAKHRFGVRVTDDARERFEARAHAAGLSSQDYLRAFVDGDVHLHLAERNDAIRLLGEIGKIGSNVNQLAKAVNQGRIKTLDADAGRILEATLHTIETLGQEIRETLL
jgi:aconitase B